MSRRKDLLALLALTLCLYLTIKIRRKRTRRRFKIRPVNRQRIHRSNSQYYNRIKNLAPSQFFKFTRMTNPVFQKLLTKIAPLIMKQKRTDGISAEKRLLITLHYLSRGTNMKALAQNFQIGHTTVYKIIHETCRAIWMDLAPEYLNSPSSAEEWLHISEEFQSKWNFPHCVGALGGKYVDIQTQGGSKSNQQEDSIVLLAACDAKYQFTLVDIAPLQREGGIFRQSIFGQSLENNDLNLPEDKKLPDSDINMPFFFVAEETFPLMPHIMRPYPEKEMTYNQTTFNNCLSQACQAIENSFGILAARWQILKNIINAKMENVDNIVRAVMVLHNFCLKELECDTEGNIYCPPGFADSAGMQNGDWRKEETPLQSVGRLGANRSSVGLNNLRDRLADYFVSDAREVAWQNEVQNDPMAT